MFDQLLDLLDRDPNRRGAPKRRGLGGLLDRVQHTLDADERRPSDHRDASGNRRDDDDRARDDDRGRPGRRRDRERFDLGDD